MLPSSTHLDDSRPKAILACYVVVSTFQLGQVAKSFLRLANTQSVSSSVCMHGVRFEEFYFQNGSIFFIGEYWTLANFYQKLKGQDLQCCSYRNKKYMAQKLTKIFILRIIKSINTL